MSKRIQCWGVVAGWGRVVEHEKGFRALYMRPLALSPMFPVDLELLKDMAAAYEIPLLMSVSEVRCAFPRSPPEPCHDPALPDTRLAQGLTLVDTPGVGARSRPDVMPADFRRTCHQTAAVGVTESPQRGPHSPSQTTRQKSNMLVRAWSASAVTGRRRAARR